MSRFTLHTMETAPKASKPALQGSVSALGMIPNLHAVMAESPQTLRAYQQLHALVIESSFSHEEKTVVWQTVNVEHGCSYCVPAHSAIARSMKVSEELDTALREREPLNDEKLEALRSFTAALPDAPIALMVERVTPVWTSRDGRDFFRLEAALGESASALRPGMEGVAKIDAGTRPLLWIWTHELIDWLRLQLWSFVP